MYIYQVKKVAAAMVRILYGQLMKWLIIHPEIGYYYDSGKSAYDNNSNFMSKFMLSNMWQSEN